MKFVFAGLMLVIIGCKSVDKKVYINMPGTYKELSQSLKDAEIDTT